MPPLLAHMHQLKTTSFRSLLPLTLLVINCNIETPTIHSNTNLVNDLNIASRCWSDDSSSTQAPTITLDLLIESESEATSNLVITLDMSKLGKLWGDLVEDIVDPLDINTQ